MAGAAQKLLDIDRIVAERGLGFALLAVRYATSISSGLRATFMPRPPPPAAALMRTG